MKDFLKWACKSFFTFYLVLFALNIGLLAKIIIQGHSKWYAIAIALNIVQVIWLMTQGVKWYLAGKAK